MVESAGGKVQGSRERTAYMQLMRNLQVVYEKNLSRRCQGSEENIEAITGQSLKVTKDKKDEVSKILADIKQQATIRLEDLDLKAPIYKSEEAPPGAHLFLDFVEWTFEAGQSVKLIVFACATTLAGYPVMGQQGRGTRSTSSNR